MSKALFQFSYNELPRAIRYEINNEQTRSNNSKRVDFVKDKLKDTFETEAAKYFSYLEDKLKLQAEAAADEHTEDFEETSDFYEQDEDQKHLFIS